jgi:hypothetical protein
VLQEGCLGRVIDNLMEEMFEEGIRSNGSLINRVILARLVDSWHLHLMLAWQPSVCGEEIEGCIIPLGRCQTSRAWNCPDENTQSCSEIFPRPSILSGFTHSQAAEQAPIDHTQTGILNPRDHSRLPIITIKNDNATTTLVKP